MNTDLANDLSSVFEAFKDKLTRFIALSEQFKNNFNQSEPNQNTETVVLLLVLQCKDFLIALYQLKTDEISANSSQLTIARSFLEALIRFDYVSSCGDVARKNLVYTDARALNKRNKKWYEAYSSTLYPEKVANTALKKTKNDGCEDLHGFFEVLQKCPSRLDGSILKKNELYSTYKDLCAPAHSDLSYLDNKYFKNHDDNKFDQVIFYRGIAAFLEGLIINLTPWIEAFSPNQTSKLIGKTV